MLLTQTILIAEDEDDEAFLLERALKKAAFTNPVRRVKNGDEVIDYLSGHGCYRDRSQYPLPIILLLDLNMPKKDGREALEEIKADPALKTIRVVVLTTSKAEADIYRTYNLSAASYITKPVTFEGLVEVIKTLGRYWLEIVELPGEGAGG